MEIMYPNVPTNISTAHTYERNTYKSDKLSKIPAQLYSDLIANFKRCQQVLKQFYLDKVASWNCDQCIKIIL